MVALSGRPAGGGLGAALPGLRRRIVIVPAPHRVTAALEDDFHRMVVTLHHDGERITAVVPVMERAPWDSCPGAQAVVEASFTGLPLARALVPGEKRANCTHLYDLAVLAGAHALDETALTYDLAISDPLGGEVVAQLHRNGVLLLQWELRDRVVQAPAELAGVPLFGLRDWIAGLAPDLAEAARMLQWVAMMAMGRLMTREARGNTSSKPPNCYSFQPERVIHASLIGPDFDFSTSGLEPLAGFDAAAYGNLAKS